MKVHVCPLCHTHFDSPTVCLPNHVLSVPKSSLELVWCDICEREDWPHDHHLERRPNDGR